MPRSQCEKENVQLVQELAEVDGPFESPINLNFRDLIKLELPSLTWNKPDSVPKKMKLTNTGHTVIISGKWKCERPYLTGGPLDGKYVFSQIHFHWGPDNCKGSEHQVCGESFPLEMHVAHFKTEYMTQESALREKDGMVVLVYLFKLQEEPNNSLKKIISALPSIRQANSSQPLECRSILALCNPFTDDYFMYWGSVVTSTCAHILLWIVCREPFGISREQMEEFRKICDVSQHPIRRNSREPQPLHKRNVFHVNASRHVDEPMLPIKNILGCFCYPTPESNEHDERKKSEGDGGCSCNPNSGPQEELEGSQDPDCRQDMEISRGNGVYMQQTVYYQHATVHSVPALPRRFDDPLGEEPEGKLSEVQDVSQSCCFLPIEEEKSMNGDKYPRQRTKEQRRKPIDSVTTLANLIDTLETLKMQTYKKLKEIESINHEIRGMKSSCENLEERHWLRHAEKIMSRQKRFTIRSSQCCFNELKKLAKECNFDKLLDDKMITGEEEGKLFITATKAADSSLLYSNASGDKMELFGLEKIESAPLTFYKSERFSRKAQKLIRSFFEDIKESEETQLNLEKNLLLKKFEKLSKRKSEISNASSLNIPLGQLYVTKNMMNMGKIREQFFTDVTPEDKDKSVTPVETKMVPAGKKKKNRSFFKMSLSGFDNSKTGTNKKGQKRSLFTKSALAWLNNRLNSLHDTGPVIPLRITDIELKSGAIFTKKKSKHSVKTRSVRKVVSEDHIRTELSSYLSESFISEFSDRQSKFSKQSMTKTRSIIRGIERSSEKGKKSEVSIMRIVKDVDANNFFFQLSNSANISSATSSDSERRNAKFFKRKSRKDIWEKGSEYRKGVNKSEMYFDEARDVQCIGSMTRNVIEKRISTSSDSSVMIKKQSKREILLFTSRKPSTVEVPNLRDVSVDATVEKSVNGPKRKKFRLEWKSKHYEILPQNANEVTCDETEFAKGDYIESECQADLNELIEVESNLTLSQDKINRNTDTGTGTGTKPSLEKFDTFTESLLSRGQNEIESQTETEKESVEFSPRQLMRDTSVEANIALPTLSEITDKVTADSLKTNRNSENETSEVSFSPRRSSDTLGEPAKNFAFDIKRTVALDNPRESYWTEEEKKYTPETNPPSEQETEIQQKETLKEEESANRLPKEEPENFTEAEVNCIEPQQLVHSGYFGNVEHFTSENKREKKVKDDVGKESEFSNLFTVEEQDKSADISRDVSQNDLSECNEYDLQTDSNGTTNYNQQKEMRSRDTTPSIPSSEDEKQQDTSVATASSILRVNSQQKPFSAESFNSFKNAYEVKYRKKRQCIKKKSKQLLRKNNSMIRKLNKIGGSNLDFTNLTEEEQLKIISANVARFVKQKLVEHKQFFDFEKNEPMTFDVEQWSKSAEQELIGEPEIVEPLTDEVKVQAAKEKESKEPEEPTPPPERQPTPPIPKEEPEPEPGPEIAKATDNHALSLGGEGAEAEKDDRNDPGKQTLDFIKLNKIMAGKYKRRCAPEAAKKGIRTVKKESTKLPAPKILSANTERETTQKPNEAPPKTAEIPPPPKVEAPPKPGTARPSFASSGGRSIRAPSADGARRGGSLQRGHKSDIPVPQTGIPRAARVTARSSSATPTPNKIATPRTTPTPPLALQKPKIPKKRLVPTYTLTSYLSTPNQIIEYQQRELDKYLSQGNDFTDFLIEGSKNKKYKAKKTRDSLSKKNLDYLIMLQKRINHEISANIENSMNYVKTLLSQDYNGTAIIEKAPVKNSLDVFEPGKGGIVLIEMNDQFDCSSSSSEFSEESGFYCIYQGRNQRDRSRDVKREIVVKRNESGDSGLVDSRIFEEVQNDTDSSYNCEVSIVVNPKAEEDPFGEKYGREEVPEVLKKYIYHLGGGEEFDCFGDGAPKLDEKKPPKKRKERMLDIPQEMKRKLLDVLEDEMKTWFPIAGTEDVTTPDDESSESSARNDADLESMEMISKISEMVKKYLNEYDRRQNSDEAPQDP